MRKTFVRLYWPIILLLALGTTYILWGIAWRDIKLITIGILLLITAYLVRDGFREQ